MSQKIKKIGVNSTVLLTSLSLAACGGGGGGYYGDQSGSGGNNSNSGNGSNIDNSTKEATGIILTLSKEALNINGDKVTVTAKAVDKDGGGVAGKTIVLNIADHTTVGASSDSSEKTTDETGTATFTVTLDGSNKSLEEITFTATIKDTTINNVRKVSVTGAGTVVQSQYELAFDNVEHLPVSGGETVVRVRAIDNNGGGVPNEQVTLAVKDFKTNNVTIKGASSAITDNEGYAVFTIVLPAGKEAARQTLLESGVQLEATLTEASGAIKTQVSTVVVDSVKSVVSSLVVTTSNNNKVDAIDGSINVIVKATNPEGNVVANKDVTLALDDLALEYGAKLVSNTAKTSATGEAIFTIKTEANSANPSGQLLVTNGITVTALLNEEGATTQTSKITVVSAPAEEVAYLNAVISDQIEISGGQATVTITAKDKNGGSVANKQITLNVPNSQNNGLTIVKGSKITTDNNGQAVFTLAFNGSNISTSTIESLLSNGVNISAEYATVSNTVITQTGKVSFYRQQTVEQSKEVQRLELTASKGVVSSTNDTVQIKVRAINASGTFAANKLVTIGLTEAATSNGVTLDGAATKQTDSSGYATFTLKVNAHNKDAIESLVESGIAVAISSTLFDGSTVKQNMQIMVEAVTLDAVDVSYLTISTDQMININKGQANVTVRAIDSNGGKLVGQSITLNIANTQQNGLTINSSKAITNSDGEANFVLSYDGSITDEALLATLKTEGVVLTAIYQPAASATTITQTTRVRYYEQSASVDVQQLNIHLGKGVVVAGNDTVDVKVQAIDENGQFVPDRKLSLALTDSAKANGVSISGASSKTSATGEATFTVKLASPNTDAINALIAEGLLVTASAQQSNGSSIFQTAKVMVVASASASVDVAYLAIDNLAAIDVDNSAEREIVVKAYNSSGNIVANKDVEIDLGSTYSSIKIKEGTKLTTNASGEAKFTLVYDVSSATSANKAKLIQEGLIVNAKYGNVAQTVKTAFYQQAVNIQRMDLVVDKAALIINTTDSQTVKTTVTLKDSQGNPVTNRQVTLAIDNNALQNGVSIIGVTGGSQVVTTDANGQAEINLYVKPTTAAAVAQLVTTGIGIGAYAVQGDGSGEIVQNTKINVVSAASLSEVSYLTTNVSDTIATTGGTSTITVKAFNSNATALSGKSVKLNLATIPTGLNIKLDAATKTTGADGTAVFMVTYTAPTTLTETQVSALLTGIQATATYTSEAGQNITQTTILQFNIDENEAAKDAARIDLITSKGAVVADNDEFTFTAKIFDKNGNPLNNKKVGIGLNTAATENGVTVDAHSKTTDANGDVTFTLKVKAIDDQKIENLIANGITLAASVVQSDGSTLSQNTRVVVNAPATKQVTALEVDIAPDQQSVSVLGGKSVVAIKAIDSDGNALVNKEVNFALSANVSSRVSVDKTTAITDSEGFAYFTVTVANGDIEDVLLEKGITFAVTTYNQGSTKPINQIGKINVMAPVESTNLTISTSKEALLASGDSAEVYVKLVDMDSKAISGYPVTLTVKDSALNGVTIAGAEKASAITDASGNTKFKIDLAKITGKQYEELLKNGVDVIASITLANGVVRTQSVNLKVSEAVSPYALKINTSKDWLSVDGDKAIITVAATNIADGSAAANQKITLKVKKTNSTTGASVGIVNQEEGDNGIIDTYTVTSDKNGNGFFTLLIPVGVMQDGKDALIASGIELEATLNDKATTDVITSQVYRLGVNDPTNITTRYSLRMASAKSILNVRNDVTDITVTLLDQNGGGVADKYITLNIRDFINNGATIVGASGKTTNENGQATFTVRIDETARHQSYSAAQFTTDDLNLMASFSTAQVISTPNVASNIFRIDVAQVSVDEQPEGHLTFGRSSLLEKSTDGNYYTESMSAQLVDKDGNAISNRTVTMHIDLLGIKKGSYLPTKDADGNPTRIKTTTVQCFGTDLPARAQIATAFIAPSGSSSNVVTYTTDEAGKFDFRVRYLRQYAGWQDVNLTANVVINGTPIQNLESRLYYSLSMLKEDFVSEAGQPFDTSPYGTNNTCD